jgi:hypothetical protein
MFTSEVIATRDLLWRMSKNGHDAECVLERTPVGPQVTFLIDGRMLASYQFVTHAQVVTWAVEKCAELSTRGWRMRYAQSAAPQNLFKGLETPRRRASDFPRASRHLGTVA